MKRRLVYKLIFLGTAAGLIYALNVLTTNYIFFPQKLHTKGQDDAGQRKHQFDEVYYKDPAVAAAQLSPVNTGNVDVLQRGGDEPLFRQDVEQNSFHHPSNLNLQDLPSLENKDVELHEKSAKLRIPYKLVHLDLKGAPPKMTYIVNDLFPLLKKAGANGILVEYEDTFPFQNKALQGVSNGAYTMDEVKMLVTEAKKQDFEIVPLIQTFGHMEFLLKRKQFKSLRENPLYPQSLCPKQKASWSLVTQMIDEILALHPDSNYVHIGCDEVYQIGECPRCKETPSKEIFLDHVKRVASYVKTKYKKKPIIWDDMLRKYYTNELSDSKIGDYVELMIWDYTEDVERLVPNYLWEMYSTTFTHIWAASAYKGAFGERLYNVDIKRHALNHLSWIKTVAKYSDKMKNFRGVALTGWSRYDHFAMLCELLPVAVPSLLLDLSILEHRQVQESVKALGAAIKCDVISIDLPLSHCMWPGDRLYNAVQELQSLEKQVKDIVTRVDSNGWMSPWNINHNYTNPWRILQFDNEASSVKSMLEILRSRLATFLDKYYQKSTRNAWLEMVVDPMLFKVTTIIRDVKKLSKRTVWDHVYSR